ncbi:GNAT family N-acetyltransferase [Streptomyces sp. NPDC002668]|uniref:GNAT family N-acetyltransferase n=1 Tax=Streptomyces sp. NPDC002668 TaxID=3154422 RepID=UPI003322715F
MSDDQAKSAHCHREVIDDDSMGRASRRKAQARRVGHRATNKSNPQFRVAVPGDAQRIVQLLALAEWEDPATPQVMGAAIALDLHLPAPGHSVRMVAQDKHGNLEGALLAGPPDEWIQGLTRFGSSAQGHMAQRVVDLEMVVVAEGSRGHGLGRQMVEHAAQDYRNRGYRLMSGSFYAHLPHLERYYQHLGFTVLGPGQPLLLSVPPPVSDVVSYPAEPTMRQMWRPLKSTVGLKTVTDAHQTLQVIDNVL